MNKKCYRYFGGLLNRQERWLNRMAAAGWRLVGTGKLCYEFEPCEPGAYEYRVEFVGQMAYEKSQDYRAFLKELGYDAFYKNVNLNWSFGKAVWRPWGEGAGQVSTNPGSYNKELILVGRPAASSPFELHTTPSDRAGYMRMLSRAHFFRAAMFLALGIWLSISEIEGSGTGAGLLTVRLPVCAALAGFGIWNLWRGFLCRREARTWEE